LTALKKIKMSKKSLFVLGCMVIYQLNVQAQIQDTSSKSSFLDISWVSSESGNKRLILNYSNYWGYNTWFQTEQYIHKTLIFENGIWDVFFDKGLYAFNWLGKNNEILSGYMVNDDFYKLEPSSAWLVVKDHLDEYKQVFIDFRFETDFNSNTYDSPLFGELDQHFVNDTLNKWILHHYNGFESGLVSAISYESTRNISNLDIYIDLDTLKKANYISDSTWVNAYVISSYMYHDTMAYVMDVNNDGTLELCTPQLDTLKRLPHLSELTQTLESSAIRTSKTGRLVLINSNRLLDIETGLIKIISDFKFVRLDDHHDEILHAVKLSSTNDSLYYFYKS
jgi:hypothetical protein